MLPSQNVAKSIKIYKKLLDIKTKINSIEKRLKTLICGTFNRQTKFNKVYISKLISDNKEILTKDKRHLKSDQISLIKLRNYCKN